jgi:hypothetical protein
LPLLAIYGTAEPSEIIEEGNYLVKMPIVMSSNYDLADGTKITFALPSNAPAGTVITDMKDVPIPVGGVPNKTQIKIKAPKSAVPAGTTINFDIKMDMTIASGIILFAKPTDPNDIDKYQKYEAAIPEQSVIFQINFTHTMVCPDRNPARAQLFASQQPCRARLFVAGAERLRRQ